tara:strand:+ start:2983 stop:3768 length:786 start_codon:yes stop_codon:yes gene_type:complete
MTDILVIGDSCTDVYIYGRCDRLCPDAPVPVLIPSEQVSNGGMAKNVYENVKSFGSSADFLTNSAEITKTRYVDEKTNQMLVRIDSELRPLDRIKGLKDISYEDYQVIIISDYCKGFLHREDIKFICSSHENVFLDTKKILGPYCAGAKIIKINEQELLNNTNAHVDLSPFKDSLITTLGREGCKHQGGTYPVKEVKIKDMTGAGDTFISSLAVNFISTRDIPTAIKFANKCSTIIVQKRGVNRIGDFIKQGSGINLKAMQ